MTAKARRKSHDRLPRRPKLPPVEDNGTRPDASPTALVVEAMRTGIVQSTRRRSRPPEEIPHEDEKILVGDPDDEPLANEYVGDEMPGGSASTPDQNLVDAIGRVYGLQEEDSGILRAGGDILTSRDRHRVELNPPRRRH
jgi:uncharacterized protein DUF6335